MYLSYLFSIISTDIDILTQVLSMVDQIVIDILIGD